jgi:Ca2+-binding EF-hand superfamily protein
MLVVFCQFLNDDEIKAIKETFYFMDEDMSGSIEIEELKKAFDEIQKGSTLVVDDCNY